MGFVLGMKCRECGAHLPVAPRAICEECFGPLEIVYDYDAVSRRVDRDALAARGRSMWRYRELLPAGDETILGAEVGFTPLVRADRLAARLGAREVYVKNDAVNFPTLSFKDRVVSVALTKAREFGMTTVGCASTGNLANSVAAQGARHGFETAILIPEDLEPAKILGTTVYGARLFGIRGDYDQVNRLCSQIADRFGWGIVNVNLRPFYGEGSKTVGYEIAEQSGWTLPGHVVSPMAGASLITKVEKAFRELVDLGLVKDRAFKIHGAQAAGCAPVIRAFQSGASEVRPVKPNTIVRSLAIGDPADGPYALQTMRRTGGSAESAEDPEVIECIKLLAETEGLFGETAGGTVVASARKLAKQGAFDDGQSVVLLITGHGLKTVEALYAEPTFATVIDGRLDEFEAFWKDRASERVA